MSGTRDALVTQAECVVSVLVPGRAVFFNAESLNRHARACLFCFPSPYLSPKGRENSLPLSVEGLGMRESKNRVGKTG
jgi:hypothetical protein